MRVEDKLRVGMSPLDVCYALRGWRFHQTYTPSNPERYHTWDFLSPDEVYVLRVTFDGRSLILWGDPADLEKPTPLAPVAPDVIQSGDAHQADNP